MASPNVLLTELASRGSLELAWATGRKSLEVCIGTFGGNHWAQLKRSGIDHPGAAYVLVDVTPMLTMLKLVWRDLSGCVGFAK